MDFFDDEWQASFETLIETAVIDVLRHENFHRLVPLVEEILAGRTKPEGHSAVDPTLLHSLATVLGRTIWNAIPLPDNNFEPLRMPWPERNAPCLCGSGRKFKKCCQPIIRELPAVEAAEIWPLVAKHLTASQLDLAIGAGKLPIELLADLAEEAFDRDEGKKAFSMLEPVFTAETISVGAEGLEYGLPVLLHMYRHSGHTKEADSLLKTIENRAPRSALRSAAFREMAVAAMHDEDSDAAWQFFRRALQDTPNAPEMGVLETLLLLADGKLETAGKRARFWRGKLQKLRIEDETVMDFLRMAEENPEAAIESIAGEMTEEWDEENMEGLLDWLEEMTVRPPLACRFEKISVDLPLADEEGEKPQNMSVSLQLKPSRGVGKLEKQWRRIYVGAKPFSTFLGGSPFDEGSGEYDPWEPENARRWIDFLLDNPKTSDSIDILDDVATALDDYDGTSAIYYTSDLLLPVLRRAEKIVRLTMAGQESGTILSWLLTENRPALRLLTRLFYHLDVTGQKKEALKLGRWLLDLNPVDNHGLRAEVVNALLMKKRNQEVIDLAGRFRNDILPDTGFGLALALYRMNRKEEAAALIRELHDKMHKHIVRYLTASRISKPEMSEFGARIGGEDQAWEYRQAMRPTWKKEPGALDWLVGITGN
ncbi:MAG: SEC-C domain-containing protein [Deltaproteobacteria bacterium]